MEEEVTAKSKRDIKFESIFSGDAVKDNGPEITDVDIDEPEEEETPLKKMKLKKAEARPVEEDAKEPEEKEDAKVSSNHEVTSLKKALDDSKSWGHKKNLALISAKKKMTDFLSKLVEEGNILEEDVQKGLSYFDLKDDEITDIPAERKADPVIEITEKLNKEFSIYKRYAKIPDADGKYGIFFHMWPLLSDEEQKDYMNYLQDGAPDEAIDMVMSQGAKDFALHHTGIEKYKGSTKRYVDNLATQNLKLKEEIKQLQSEIDNTTEKVYSRSINSKVSGSEPAKQKFDFATAWEQG